MIYCRYDGVVAARQLALNLIETLQQELAQFLQTNPPSMVNIQAIPQNTMQQNIVQHSPQVGKNYINNSTLLLFVVSLTGISFCSPTYCNTPSNIIRTTSSSTSAGSTKYFKST